MVKRLIAWITVVSVMLAWGIVGDVADIIGMSLDALTIRAEAENDFEIDENGVLTKYHGSAAVVVIPEGVSAIGANAFYQNQTITGVTLTDDVKTIGNSAFSFCTSLVNVTFGDSLETIGQYAFQHVPLTEIELPDSVTSIGKNAFTLTSCTKFRWPGSIATIPNSFFARSPLEEIEIGSGVTAIGQPTGNYESGVFYNCTSLQMVTMPETVTSIGPFAFYRCEALEGVTLSAGLEVIGASAFEHCSALERIDVPDGTTTIEKKAFSDCVNLAEAVLPDSLLSIGAEAFVGCQLLQTLSMQGDLESIGEGAFRGCKTLENVVIPNKVTEIGGLAFYGCTSLAGITLGTKVQSIGRYAFNGCKLLSAVSFPDSMRSIGECAFNDCTSLSTVTFSSGLESIGMTAFGGAPVTKVELPDSVTSIGKNAFTLTSCEEFRWPAGVTTIPKGFFRNSALERIVIPSGVTSIGQSSGNYEDGAFYNSKKLQTVTIPETVTNIGSFAFYKCEALEGVTLSAGLEVIGANAFERCSALERIDVPEGVTALENFAFRSCENLTEVTLPTSLKRLGDGVFNGCAEPELWLPDDMEAIGRSSSCRTHVSDPDCATAHLLSGVNMSFFIGDDTDFALRYRYVDGVEVLCLFAYLGDADKPELPDSVEYIYDNAFYKSDIRQIEIEEGIEGIGKSAFNGSRNLTDVYLPRTMDNISEFAFYGGKRIQFHVYYGSFAEEYLQALRYNYTYRDASLRVTVPEGCEGLTVLAQAEGLDDARATVSDGSVLFPSLKPNTLYTVKLVNRYGYELAEAQTVQIGGGASEISIPQIVETGDIRAVVRDAETHALLNDQVTVEWLDADDRILCEEDALHTMPVDTALACRIILDDAMASEYQEIEPTVCTVCSGSMYLSLPLTRYETRSISGRVTQPLNADVTVIQHAASSSRALITTTQTDANGYFVLDVPALDAEVHFAAQGYVTQTVQAPLGTDTLAAVTLQTIDGVRVYIGASLTRAARPGENAESIALDIRDLDIAVMNTTTGSAISNVVRLSDSVILTSGAASGDSLSITLSGEGMASATVTAGVDSNLTAAAQAVLKELGGALVQTAQAPDYDVLVMAFDASDRLAFSQTFPQGEALRIQGLTMGSYTLLLAQASDFLDAPQARSALPDIAAAELNVDIADGVISDCSIGAVPALDESALQATVAGQAIFHTSRSGIEVGRNFTLSACAPITEGATAANFRWIFEYPATSVYVDATLSEGSELCSNALLEDGRITLPTEDPGRKVRFCLRAMEPGEQRITGWLEYDLNGRTRRQMIGRLTVNAEGLRINVKASTNEPRVYAYGIAPYEAEVRVYDDDTLIAETTADQYGKWGIWADLDNPGPYSTHYISATYTSFIGLTLPTESQRVVYHYMEDPVSIYQVRMRMTSAEDDVGEGTFAEDKSVIFDFVDPSRTTKSFRFSPRVNYGQFLVLLHGDISSVTRVKLNVICSDSSVKTLKGIYDEALGGWHCVSQFSARCLPVGVTVHYVSDSKPVFDDSNADIFSQYDDPTDDDPDQATPEEVDITSLGEIDLELTVAINDYNASLRSLKQRYETWLDHKLTMCTELESILDNPDCMIAEKSTGLSESELLTQDFEVYTTGSHGKIYIKLEEERRIEIVDFSRDIYSIIDIQAFEDKIKDINISQNLKDDLRNYNALKTACQDFEVATRRAYNLMEEKDAEKQNVHQTTMVMRGLHPMDEESERNWQRAKQAYKDLVMAFTVDTLLPPIGMVHQRQALVQLLNQLEELKEMQRKYPNCPWLDRSVMWQKNAIAANYIAYGVSGADGGKQMMQLFKAAKSAQLLNLLKRYSLPGVLSTLYAWFSQWAADNAYNYSIAHDPGKTMQYGESSCPEPQLVNPPSTTNPIIDPSGFVYEAVESNRVAGATCKVIQRVTRYDMYDEAYTQDEVWNAEAYDQTNPQVTGDDGQFAWDVPDGLWSVSVTKPGYEASSSEWMTVPPEQKDVRIALVNLDPPMLQSATRKGDGVEVVFDKYVVASQLSGGLTLKVDGVAVNAEVSVLDAEASPTGTLLATRAMVTPTSPLTGDEGIALQVSESITSYAGVKVGGTVTYDIASPAFSITLPEGITLLKGVPQTVTVSVAPKLYAKGMKLTCTCDEAAMTAQVLGTVNSNGEAMIQLTAMANGTARLELALNDSKASAEKTITIVDPDAFNVLRLPPQMIEVSEEAFMGSAAEIVVLPAGCKTVASRAFANCSNLKYLLIARNAKVSIAPDAYDHTSVIILYYN